MKQYTATANDDGVRLSRFVQSVTRDFPTSLLYKSFRNKRVKVNGKKAVPEYRIQAGDLIELYINDEFSRRKRKTVQKAAPKKSRISPRSMSFMRTKTLLCCTNHHFCAIATAPAMQTLWTLLPSICRKRRVRPPRREPVQARHLQPAGPRHRGPCDRRQELHRLRDMNEIIRTDLLKKEYYTITVGIPQSGRFTAWWEHDEKNNKVSIHAHQSQDERRKQIITDVDVLRTAGPFACARSALSPAVPTRSVHIWPIWTVRFWATSSTATAR